MTSEEIKNLFLTRWPNSTKITDAFCWSWKKWLDANGVDETVLQQSLSRYSAGSAKAQWPPATGELKPYLPAGEVHVQFPESRLWEIFISNVCDMGWSEAVLNAKHCQSGYGPAFNAALRDLILRTGIDENHRFEGLAETQVIFLNLLIGEGDVVAAYRYAFINTASEDTRRYFSKRLEFYERIGNERARLYFPYLRRQAERAKRPPLAQAVLVADDEIKPGEIPF